MINVLLMLIWKSPDHLEFNLELHDLSDVQPPNDHSFLSQTETQRSQQIQNEEARLTYIKSRWLLKKKIHELSDRPLNQIDFLLTGEGKPGLSENQLNLDFNISHKDNFYLVGWCFKSKIGVDLELDKKKVYKPSLSTRFFLTEEILEIESALDPQRKFLQLWSLKEALVKLNAGSLFKDAKQSYVRLKDLSVLKVPNHFMDASKTQIYFLEIQDRFLISVAIGK